MSRFWMTRSLCLANVQWWISWSHLQELMHRYISCWMLDSPRFKTQCISLNNHLFPNLCIFCKCRAYEYICVPDQNKFFGTMLHLWVNVTRLASSGRSRNHLRRNFEEWLYTKQNYTSAGPEERLSMWCKCYILFVKYEVRLKKKLGI
jgi:hypothetical protein